MCRGVGGAGVVGVVVVVVVGYRGGRSKFCICICMTGG